MLPLARLLRVLIIALLIIAVIFPFLVTLNLETDSAQRKISDAPLRHQPPPASGSGAQTTTLIDRLHNGRQQRFPADQAVGKIGAPVPLPRKCSPGKCAPRRYFATTNQHPPLYYLEPNLDHNGRHGMFSNIPSRPWDESSLVPLDLYSESAAELVRTTIEWRNRELLESDLRWNSQLPKYLPPQFPQWDRSIQNSIASPSSTIVGIPPECCPSNANFQFLTKNWSDANVLSEDELNDCRCRSPRNYPTNTSNNKHDGPIATLVTAFYQMSSKHPVKMYEKNSGQLLATADPMIIFCEPNSTWVDFFIKNRKHAPTIVVPLSANDLTLKQHFPQETFWKKQYDIDPEGLTHHNGVNTMLYVIWDEKLVLLQSAAMLNPFNTTQFVWVDTGYWRNPAPHLYRKSAVMIDITKEGVKEDAALLFQMIPYTFDRDVVISGDQVLVGGNCFAGTYSAISNFYSAFYETFWTMAATGKFVGSDQKVMYRTCHTYPDTCHIHKPKKMRSWLGMLGELLPNIGGKETIKEPLQVTELIPPEENLPLPPNEVVDDATAGSIWKGVKRVP